MIGKTLSWIACDGGPHLVLPREELDCWQPKVDYARACEIAGERDIGPIVVGQMLGLVIGGREVPMSAWLGRNDGAGGDIVVVLEWGGEATDEDIVNALGDLPASAMRQASIPLRVATGGLVLFAACDFPGRWIYSHRDIRLQPGIYQVSTVICEVGDNACVRVHRLAQASH